jgi:hypothetical protein
VRTFRVDPATRPGRALAVTAFESGDAASRERGPVKRLLYEVLALALIILIGVAVVTSLDTGCAPGNC